MIEGLRQTGWIRATTPIGQPTAAPAPASLPSVTPLDRFTPAAAAATAPTPPRGLLRALAAVAGRVAASVLPFGYFVPTFAAPGGSDIPQDFLKACGKRPERARALLARLETLPASERDAAREEIRRMVKGTGTSVDPHVLGLIDEAAAMPRPAERLAQIRELVSLSNHPQALTDVRMARQAAGIAPEAALSLVTRLRDADPGRKNEYPSFDNLDAPFRYLATLGDATLREAAFHQIERFQGSRRGPSKALPFVLAVNGFTCDEAEKARVRDVVRGLLKSYGGREDAHLLAALAAVEPAHPLEGVDVLESFLDEVKNPVQALDDLRTAQAAGTTAGAPLSEAAAHLLALRQAEPTRKSDYRSFTPMRAALDHVMAAADRDEARERLVRLQQKKASADEVLPLERALIGLKVADDQRTSIRDDLIYVLAKCGRDERRTLGGVLAGVDGKPDAAARVAALKKFYNLDARRLSAAIADLQLAASAADKHQLSFDVAASRLADLREQDRGRKSDYPTFANLAAPLDALLASGGASRDDLVRLAVNGRTPEQALPHLQRLQKLAGTDADRRAVGEEWRAILKRYGGRSDATMLSALDLIAVPDAAETRARLTCFRDLLALSKRPDQACADLRVAVAQAASSGRAFADAARAVCLLREADPCRKDDYPTFTPVDAVAAQVLADKRPVEACVRDLQALQAKGRTPADALRHEAKLAAVSTSPATRVAVRAAYASLLKKTSRRDDATLLALLDRASSQASPAEVVEGFASLLRQTGKTATAFADVEGCLGHVKASGPSLDEMLRHAVALRECDPARRDDYQSYQPLAPTLDFVSAGADAAARQARCDLLRRVLKCGLSTSSALLHAQRLSSLKVDAAQREAVVSAYLDVAARGNNKTAAVLDTIDGHPQALAAMQAFTRLVKIKGLGWDRAASDLASCSRFVGQFSAVTFGEVAGYVQSIRKAESGQEYPSYRSLDACLPVILAGADPARRAARADSLVRLIKRGQAGQQTLTYLVADAVDPLPRATTTLLRLAGKARRQTKEDALRAVYAQVQKATKDEPQSLLARWIHWPRTFERIAWRLLATQTAPDTAAYLEAMQTGRFDGERFKQTYARLQQLLSTGQKGDPAGLIAEAFAGVNRPMACGTLDASQRWSLFTGLLDEVKSASAASAIWKAMAGAGSESEMNARRAAWPSVLAACKGAAPAAASAYAALIETLQPNDRVDAELGHLVTLCQQQPPTMVPATWRSLQRMKGLSPEEKTAMRDMLVHAATAEELDSLWALATTPLGSEQLADRAAVLIPLLRATHSVQWSAGALKTMQSRLRGEVAGPSGAAVAALTGLLYDQGHPSSLEAALDAVDWAEKLRVEGSDDPSVSEILTEVAAAMLLNEDFEAARAHVATSLSQRRKDARGPGRVEIGETEVVVGGIKIRKRSDDAVSR